MSQIISLSNDKISISINSLGAAMTSMKKGGIEHLWEGDPKVWEGQAPVLFPICGGLMDDKFILDGKEYFIEKHGYARFCEFEVESKNDTTATFLLRADEESLKNYPFNYEFRIIYTLIEESIKIDYSVTNIGDNTMYYAVGAHEAYACPEGIEEYSIVFEKNEELYTDELTGNFLNYKKHSVPIENGELALKNEFFETDALVFTDIKSRKATLRHKTKGDVLSVDFEGLDYLLLWTIAGAKYICIEPWCSLPDYIDSDYNIKNKQGIVTLPAGENKVHSHTINL